MGRPRKFESDAERQAAYRRREGAEPGEPAPSVESVTDEQALRDRLGYTDSEKRTKAERDEAARRMVGKGLSVLTEDEYVAVELAITRHYVSSFRAPEKSSPTAIKERLERAEAYARWRWNAYQAGEVFSL